MTQIKICGITDDAALDATLRARVDYAGFVFFPPSPRNVSIGQAAAFSARAGGAIRKVGLFVDPDDTVLTEATSSAGLDAIQLHGNETPQRCADVKARFELPVWKAIAVADAADIAGSDRYREAADLLLFDARTPDEAALPGGMGLRFDWTLLANYRGALPWGLAGGLSADNVARAIAATGTGLVDASSGVESAPGAKDPDKIAAFCKAARGS